MDWDEIAEPAAVGPELPQRPSMGGRTVLPELAVDRRGAWRAPSWGAPLEGALPHDRVGFIPGTTMRLSSPGMERKRVRALLR
jgi:hypothetical protein